jgi:hypothetical protein
MGWEAEDYFGGALAMVAVGVVITAGQDWSSETLVVGPCYPTPDEDDDDDNGSCWYA